MTGGYLGVYLGPIDQAKGTTMNDRQKRLERIERRKNADVFDLTETRIEQAAEAIRLRAIQHTIAADKAGVADDDLDEVRHTAKAEALVWALAVITGRDEAEVQVDILTATDTD